MKKLLSIALSLCMVLGMCVFVALNYLGQRFFAFREDADPSA